MGATSTLAEIFMHAISERGKPIDSYRRDLSLHEVDWKGQERMVGKSYQCFGLGKEPRERALVPNQAS